MPIGIGAAAAISGGAQLASSGINAAQTANLNKKNRAFADSQRQKQYESELEFWRMNNEYNHPSAQMARLREGGLNPHLVYGNGTVVGNSSSAPNAPQQAKWEGTPPQISGRGVAQGLDQYVNLTAKQAQTDNLREQNTLLKKEQMLKDMELLQRSVNLDKSKLGFSFDKQTFESRVYREMLNNIDTQSLINSRNMATGIMESKYQNFDKENWQRTLQQKDVGIAGQQVRNELAREHLRLRRQGIEPGDIIYIRMMASILNKFGIEL